MDDLLTLISRLEHQASDLGSRIEKSHIMLNQIEAKISARHEFMKKRLADLADK